MLKVKLARFGKKKQPHFRIVINEDRDKRDGSYVAQVGIYAPAQTPKTLQIDLDAYRSWLSKGAQPTDTVAALVKRLESGNPFPPKKAQLSRKAKAKLAAEAEAKAAAAAAPAPAVEAEAPAEAAVEVAAAPTEPAATEAPAETPAAS